MNPPQVVTTHIKNYQKLLDHFGYWPDFHDGEIINTDFNDVEKTLLMKILALEDTPHKDVHKAIVTLKFSEVETVELTNKYSQNVIFTLEFEETDGKIKTILSSSIGLEGSIIAKNIDIVKIEPLNRTGSYDKDGIKVGP